MELPVLTELITGATEPLAVYPVKVAGAAPQGAGGRTHRRVVHAMLLTKALSLSLEGVSYVFTKFYFFALRGP